MRKGRTCAEPDVALFFDPDEIRERAFADQAEDAYYAAYLERGGTPDHPNRRLPRSQGRRRFKRHLRTVCRIRFEASSLVAGRRLVKSLSFEFCAFLGRNVKPGKEKLIFG